MINCLIIDDEPLAREGIAGYVKELDFLRLVGTFETPLEVISLLDQRQADLIFLDIQTPKMNGIDFLKTMQRPPMIVITTAFPSFALEGYQLNVLDYLLKPITFGRFVSSANKARDYHHLITRSAAPGIERANGTAGHFFVKSGSKFIKIHFDDILYAEGMQNYSTIYTRKGKYVIFLFLKHLEQNLDRRSFLRVHKSYIVSIDKVDSIEGNDILMGSHRIPISRNYRDLVIKEIVANNLWDKIKFS